MKFSSRYLDVHFPPHALQLQTIPIVTWFLIVAYVTFSVVLWITRHRSAKVSFDDFRLVFCPILQIVPDKVAKYPISILTSNLIDTELWKFFFGLLNLILGGSYIERCWNSRKEMLRYTLLIGSVTNFGVWITIYILSIFFDGIRLDLPFDGNYMMIIGYSIVYKQLLPETTLFEIKNLPFISKNFRFKLLPIFIMFVLTVSELFWRQRFLELLPIWTTFFVCWVYLRFYQVLPSAITGDISSDEIVGDASDTFQLVYFFPDLFKPILQPILNKIYDILIVRFRWREPFVAHDVEMGNTLMESRGAKRVVTAEERRKQLALKVLEQRMSGSSD